MSDTILIEPKLGTEELSRVARRIAKIYRQVQRLMAARPPQPLRAMTFVELTAQPIRSRLESVDDAISGLEYAVWAIGSTIAAMGGSSALHFVFGLFEDEEGSTRASSWLDHRWNGVTDGTFVWSS